MTSFNHWLLIVNASFNFLIYCSVGTNFKEVIVASSKCCVKIFGSGIQASSPNNGDATSVSESVTTRLRTKRWEEELDDLLIRLHLFASKSYNSYLLSFGSDLGFLGPNVVVKVLLIDSPGLNKWSQTNQNSGYSG